MGENWSLKNYKVAIEETTFKVTKETVGILKRAMFECETEYSDFIHKYAQCFSVAQWLEGFLLEIPDISALRQNNLHLDDKDDLQKIATALKKSSHLGINRLAIKRKRKCVMQWDLRFENRLNAEQIINDQVLLVIFKDYLHDNILRDEVIKRVQDILDLIYNHMQGRKEKKEDLKKQEEILEIEYKQKLKLLDNDYYKSMENLK